MTSLGYKRLHPYIDDLIYVGPPSKIYQAYTVLLVIMAELGLDIGQKPCTSSICLGINVDTITRTISIPQDTLLEIKELCQTWTVKKATKKRQLQSILGSLLYITKSVRPARFFWNLMTALSTFLTQYNGVTFYANAKPKYTVHLDASLSALGGTFADMVYTLAIPHQYNNYSIVHLEILNIMVALKIWGHYWNNQYILL